MRRRGIDLRVRHGCEHLGVVSIRSCAIENKQVSKTSLKVLLIQTVMHFMSAMDLSFFDPKRIKG